MVSPKLFARTSNSFAARAMPETEAPRDSQKPSGGIWAVVLEECVLKGPSQALQRPFKKGKGKALHRHFKKSVLKGPSQALQRHFKGTSQALLQGPRVKTGKREKEWGRNLGPLRAL